MLTGHRHDRIARGEVDDQKGECAEPSYSQRHLSQASEESMALHRESSGWQNAVSAKSPIQGVKPPQRAAQARVLSVSTSQ